MRQAASAFSRTAVAMVLLAGCTSPSLPAPMRDNETGNLLSSTCWRAAQKAQAGDREAFHDCFFAAYSRVRDPMLGGEDLESIDLTLEKLLSSVGDHVFARRLHEESPPIRSGVAWFLKQIDLQSAPETKAVTAAAHDYNFELERASRENR